MHARGGAVTVAPCAEVLPLVAAACAVLTTTATTANWESADGAQMLMRLLCASPFSAHDVRQPAAMVRHPRGGVAVPVVDDMPLCRALGTLLDLTVLPRHRRRSYANAWLVWAHRCIRELAGAFACTARSPKPFLPCVEPRCLSAARTAADADDEDGIDRCAVEYSDIESGSDGSDSEDLGHRSAGAAHAQRGLAAPTTAAEACTSRR